MFVLLIFIIVTKKKGFQRNYFIIVDKNTTDCHHISAFLFKKSHAAMNFGQYALPTSALIHAQQWSDTMRWGDNMK